MSSLLNKITGGLAGHSSTTASAASAASPYHPMGQNTEPVLSSAQHTGSTLSQGSRRSQGLETQGYIGAMDNAIVRNEERLVVGKEKVSGGSVNVDKYVTKEHVSTNVSLMKEKVVIEREPVRKGDLPSTLQTPVIGEQHVRVDLTQEKVVGIKETIPVEKIHVVKQRELTNQTVAADLRKEQINIQENLTNEAGHFANEGRNTGTTKPVGFNQHSSSLAMSK
jgi:uncharacterized protein (TIGR02271 family)